jgi:hypothetical protein
MLKFTEPQRSELSHEKRGLLNRRQTYQLFPKIRKSWSLVAIWLYGPFLGDSKSVVRVNVNNEAIKSFMAI